MSWALFMLYPIIGLVCLLLPVLLLPRERLREGFTHQRGRYRGQRVPALMIIIIMVLMWPRVMFNALRAAHRRGRV